MTAIDREALRIRYRSERDKRLRADGNDQYVEPTGSLSSYLDDPWTEHLDRPPVTDDVDVAFVGAGFAGLVTGALAAERGRRVRLVEKGGDVGGTWYWNRYPGAQCDTTSFVYLPLLEETGHMPTEKYAHGPEIREHCRRIAQHYGLYDDALLGTEVTGLEWDDAAARWVVTTHRGDRFTTRFVAIGTGPLHRPKLPGVPGIEAFEGHSFHTSRWDYEYTGGDPAGAPMDRLAGRRVGIIGTGATAVQCVPHLARSCGELFVFQRTPSSIDVRANRPTDPDWFATLEPGWQQRWLENFTVLQTGGFVDEDLTMDGWTDITKRIRDRVFASPEPDLSPQGLERAYHETDDEKMTEIRARVDEIVRDRATAEALKPWYRQLCKRPCFHDEFLDAFNRPNVHLVDTDGQGVERIDATGVWANGEHYELDCIIYASGFEVGTEQARRSGFDPIGRNGLRLSEKWADGMQSFQGMFVHGFPNLFVVGSAQAANLISNYPHNLVEAGRTIAVLLAHAAAEGIDEIEVTAEAEAEWVDRIAKFGRRFGNNPDCTPGYYNNEGHDPGRRALLNAGYPEGPVAFFQYLDAWRSTGRFEGLDLRRS